MLIRLMQASWRKFCHWVVTVFYRRLEIDGLEYLPAEGPVLLCANHANALADVLIIQAITARLVHPVARSGLFSNWLLKPFMLVMQAVPVYRRQDNDGDTSANALMFRRCYEMFHRGELVLIFPEGQSHSDPSLRPIKTGAARMTLGALEQDIPLSVIPVGLNFTDKGKFRSNVFIKLMPAIDLSAFALKQDEETVRSLTKEIHRAMDSVTLNVIEADDMDFLKHVERFFAMRHGKYRQRDMSLKFRALKKIRDAYYQLLQRAPEQIEKLKKKLRQFDRLCQNWKLNAYHVTVQYTPAVVSRFILRSLFILLVIMPTATWGVINSGMPYLLTRSLAMNFARGTDQYDTAKMSAGLILFSLFWSLQVWSLAAYLDHVLLTLYIISLPVSAAAALFMLRERHHLWDNMRVFFLFLRKRKLRRHLDLRRKELEQELARLVRMAKDNFHKHKHETE